MPYHLQEYGKVIQSINGHRAGSGIAITLTGVPVAARFNQTVRAWRRNVMYQLDLRLRVAHRS
jgi:hypothetical protein